MAGYSGNPLVKKLGLKDGFMIHVINPPQDYFNWISPLPPNLTVKPKLQDDLDFIHLFIKDEKSFQKAFVQCKNNLKSNGMLWISWPKKSSKVPTDLDENKIREYGLKEGLVDVKVCAVDEIWSGLKFVVRLKDR